MLYISSLIRWLQRKRYQYEVTFSLYMLTPMEKFIFSTGHPPDPTSSLFSSIGQTDIFRASIDSFLFLFLSMIIIAASLYLPSHIATISRRAWFYYAGDEASAGVLPSEVGTGSGDRGKDVIDMLGRM